MTCFGYLCYIFDNWCQCSDIDEITPKFYNPTSSRQSITRNSAAAGSFDSFGSSAFNFYASTKPLSARNKSVKFNRPHLDIVPKAASDSGGDWIMRYTMEETNFNPWNFGTKFRHFELVPWRKQKPSIDLLNNLGWEPPPLQPPPPPASGGGNDDSLEIYRKIKNRKRKKAMKHLKKRLDRHERKIKRHIKIRVMFAVEFRHSKTQVIRSKIVKTNNVKNSRSNEIFIFDELAANREAIMQNDASAAVIGDEHWGYFSQRNKGVEEILIGCCSDKKMIQSEECENKFNYNHLVALKSSQNNYRRPLNNLSLLLCINCRQR